jgi:hypothetical protein
MSSEITLRDTFAAAAVPGMIVYAKDNAELCEDQVAHWCYEIADAMLLRRDETNHDAAPAATASDGGDDGLQARLAGTGDTPKAVAWVIRLREGVVVTYSRDTADHWRDHGHYVTEITPPIATAPSATKEELKALRNAIEDATVIQIRNEGRPLARVYARQEKALLSLFSKLGGGT